MERNKKRRETSMETLLYRKASNEKIPLGGTFELTPLCNFNCRMCYIRQSPEQIKQKKRQAFTLEQWMDLADQTRNEGLLYLLLTGGEPFMWPDFWKLYEYLADKGFVVSINSNGSMIDDTAVARLKKMPLARLNITLYGASDKTYERLCRNPEGYYRTVKAIDMLLNAGLQVKLNASMTPYNIDDLGAIVHFAKERELILQVATYMFPPMRSHPEKIGQNDRFTPEKAAYWMMKSVQLQNGEEAYLTYLENIQKGMIEPVGLDPSCMDSGDGKMQCRAGRSNFWATWDGYLLPCGLMNGMKEDLSCMDFRNAWEAICDKTEKIRTSGVCKECKDQRICNTCGAIAMGETGSYDGIPRYMCEMMQAMRRIAADELKIYGG